MKDKIVVYEFAGLSGCGKTTLCNEVISSIPEKKIITRQMVLKCIGGNGRKKAIEFLMNFSFRNRDFMKLLKEISLSYGKDSYYGFYFLLALYVIIKKISFFKKDSVVILEEGFVQNITSLAHTGELVKDEKLDSLVAMINDRYSVKVIKCNLDETESLKRIRKRAAKDRLNAIESDDELLIALKQKSVNIERAVQYFDIIASLDMSLPTEELLKQCPALNEIV